MKHSIIKYLKKVLVVLTAITLIHCGNDDDVISNNNSINVQELITLNVDENTTVGQPIGMVNATSNSPLVFTIQEQTFANAIAIHPNTGEVRVADASFFDFETNPIIQAVINISNGIETVLVDLTIDLNNTDDIEFFLTASKQLYINANDGEWIEISEEEYNNVALGLNEVSKIATADADYDNINLPSTISNTAADTTVANNNGVTMPSGSYLFAFKYTSGGVTTAMRAKQSSTDIMTGYENVGGTFPMSPANGNHYLILKASNSPTTAEGFLAFYSPIKSFRNYPPSIFTSGMGNTNMLPDLSSSNLFIYQGLSSTQKQWE